MGLASLKRRLLAVQPQIVGFQTGFPPGRPCGVDTPETDGVVRRVVKKAWLIEVRTHGKSVHQPLVDFAFDHKPIKAQAYVGSLADVDEAAGAVLELLSANS